MNRLSTVPLTRSIYWKIATVFVVVVTALTAALIWFWSISYLGFLDQLEQQTNWQIAQELVRVVEPALRNETVDPIEFEKRLFPFIAVNPRLEAYLLSADGEILAFVAPYVLDADRVSKVSLQPIEQALSNSMPSFPIYGSSGKIASPQEVFSVARVLIGGQPGYLYVILNGSLVDKIVQNYGQFFLAKTILLGAFVTWLCGTLLGFSLLYFLSKHFRQLTRVIGQYRKGNFAARIESFSDDEIGVLARTVNAMADTIVEMTEQLRQTDRQRRELIANISHDLRSPLTSVRGYVETLLEKDSTITQQERKKYLESMLSTILSQNQLIGDLFELSKLDAREKEPQLEAFPIEELARDVLQQFSPEALGREVTLECRSMGLNGFVVADPVMIRRVLMNLVQNALRYTSRPGTITISLEGSPDHVVAKVSDTGPGISAEHQKRIFESFYRVEGDRPRSGGAGLGLAIVKRILELHGQQIEVTSVPGSGATFYFSLPLESNAAVAGSSSHR